MWHLKRQFRRSFTAVELLVVLGIVVALLVVGLPAFSQMRTQAERSQARQAIDTALRQAYVLAVSTRTTTAVRFVPAQWEVFDEDNPNVREQQVISIYQLRFSSVDPENVGNFINSPLNFNQRFEPVSSIRPVAMPAGLWVAPVEATDVGSDVSNGILDGAIASFVVDGVRYNNNLFEADDFLVVFDPESGLRPTVWPRNSTAPNRGFQLLGYDPLSERRTAWQPQGTVNVNQNEPYQRVNFTGVVLYEREPFVERFGAASSDERARFLLEQGERFYVNPTAGGVIPASEAKES